MLNLRLNNFLCKGKWKKRKKIKHAIEMRYEFRRRCRIIWFCIGLSPLRSTLVDQLVLVTTLFSCYIDNVWFGLLWATALPRVPSHNVIAYRSMLHMSTGSAARWSAPQRQHGTTIHRASHAYAKYVEIYVIHFSIVNLQRKS